MLLPKGVYEVAKIAPLVMELHNAAFCSPLSFIVAHTQTELLGSLTLSAVEASSAARSFPLTANKSILNLGASATLTDASVTPPLGVKILAPALASGP